MRRPLLTLLLAAGALAAPAAANAAAPTGFTPPRVVGANLQVDEVASAVDPADGTRAAIAYLDRSGDIWATRVRPDGTAGSPLPVAQRQQDVRDLQVAITERNELVVLWAAFATRSHGALRYAVTKPGIAFSGARTLATVSSNTGATPRMAALRGGTVAVIYRDRGLGGATGTLRYARRPAGGLFGPVRFLGHDGVGPQIVAAPGGGALLAWGRGDLGHRALQIAAAKKGAALPGTPSTVAGDIRDLTLAASRTGDSWVTWTRRAGGPTTGYARSTRSIDVLRVGPVQSLGTVAYGVPHVSLTTGGSALVAWSAQGPGTLPNVTLAAAVSSGTSLDATRRFDAGGFSQTSPIPALLGGGPLEPVVLFTRQVPQDGAFRNEVVAADPGDGAGTVLGTAATISTPAVTRLETGGALVAWPAAAGGVAVSVHP